MNFFTNVQKSSATLNGESSFSPLRDYFDNFKKIELVFSRPENPTNPHKITLAGNDFN